MLYRVIAAIPNEPYSPPPGAVLASGHIDYIERDAAEIPADALYVAKMDEVDQVSIMKEAPDGFVHEHTFAGWPPVYRLG